MAPPVEIRPLAAEHAPAYRTLMLEAYDQAADAFTSTAEERAREPLSWWVQRLASPLGQSFGAFLEGALVGTVALEYSARAKTRHSAHVIGMYVQPAARGRHAGQGLMRAAVAAAQARTGVRVMRLTVTEGNTAAIRLYEAVGFRAWGVEPWTIDTPRGLQGKVHMALALDAALRRDTD